MCFPCKMIVLICPDVFLKEPLLDILLMFMRPTIISSPSMGQHQPEEVRDCLTELAKGVRVEFSLVSSSSSVKFAESWHFIRGACPCIIDSRSASPMMRVAF